jgi:hypothetical protein
MTPRIAAFLLLGMAGCNPYAHFDGEFYAGPIDPTEFQAPYVGDLPGTADQSGGTIHHHEAFVDGKKVVYYLFPFSDGQNSQFDPLAIGTDSAPAPKGFVFDPMMDSPFADPAMCKAPSNYHFDQRKEAYRKDEQGAIFYILPSNPLYVPVVQENPVHSKGEACQEIKSKQKLLNSGDVTVDPNGDGKYLAFAIIDPGADVTPFGPNGVGPVHFGWYGQFLLAFLDGGYIPTEDIPPAPPDVAPYTRMKAQTLLAPTQIPVLDPGTQTMVPGRGGVGTNWDIVEAGRAGKGYTPVCHVITYTPDDPLHPKKAVADLSATELASAGSAAADQGYVFCFQPY